MKSEESEELAKQPDAGMQESWHSTEFAGGGSRREIRTVRSKEKLKFRLNYERYLNMRPHEKLDVWKRAIEFVVAIYRMTETFPRDKKFGLTSQIRRAAVSVPANIAEGAGRHTAKEFKYSLSNAQGSVSELATELLIAQKLGYLKKETFDTGNRELTSIGRMILGLSRSVSPDS